MPEKFQEFLKTQNIELMTPYKKGAKMRFRFSCGHHLLYTEKSLKENIRLHNGKASCKYCKGTKISKESLREEIKRVTNDEYKLISCSSNLTARSKIKVLHKNCKHSYEVTVTNFRQGRRCPCCSSKETDSKGSILLTTLLDFFNIKYEKEKTFSELKNPLTGRLLRYDFYLPEYNLLIEVDGAQHYQEVAIFAGSLSQTQDRDLIKDTFAIKNGIKLIRIPLFNPFSGNSLSDGQTRTVIFNFIYKFLMEEEFTRLEEVA